MILTKNEFATLRTEIETLLAPLAAKYGCEISAGNIKYDEILTTVSLQFKSCSNDKSADQLNFEKYCVHYGFGPEDYGFTFTVKDKTYTFKSFKPSARKYPCICECSDGKSYAFTDEAIKLEIRKAGM
jgi:hypothetical protein